MVEFKKTKIDDEKPRWIRVVEEARAGLAMLDNMPDNPAAEEFAASVETKLCSIIDWCCDRGTVTDRQAEAVTNMCNGIAGWVQ